MISELWQPGFLRDALVASLLIGLMLSVLGVFVVLRRIVFVGAALAQVSAMGVALSFLVASALGAAGEHAAGAASMERHPELIALAATLVGAALLSLRPRKARLHSEAVIGLGFALASTLAILLVAKTPGGEGDTLLLLYGNILAVTPKELVELSIVCPLILLVLWLFFRPFLLISYQPDTARAAGVRVDLWALLLYGCLGVAIAVGIRAAGSLLTFSFLVLPAVCGLLVGRRTWHVSAVAVLVSVAASVTGLLLSLRWDLPSGPMIVAVLVLAAAVCWLGGRAQH